MNSYIMHHLNSIEERIHPPLFLVFTNTVEDKSNKQNTSIKYFEIFLKMMLFCIVMLYQLVTISNVT